MTTTSHPTIGTDPHRGVAHAYFVTAFLLFLGAAVWFAFLVPIRGLLGWVQDDSLFYFQIAWNFSDTGRFTYDGIHDTYGFQPLWQIVLSILAVAFEDREAFFRTGVFLCAVFHLAGGVVLYRLLLRLLGRTAAIGGTAFWLLNPFLLFWDINGKENALYAFLLIASISVLHGRVLCGSGRRRDAVLLGVLLGLTFLARVNSLVFIMLCMGAISTGLGLRGQPWTRRLSFVALTGIVLGAVAGPWLAFAHGEFGSLLPTSGVSKFRGMSAWVRTRWDVEWLSMAHVLRGLQEVPTYYIHLWDRLAGPLQPWFVLFLLGSLLSLRSRVARVDRRALVVLGLAVAWALLNSAINVVAFPSNYRYAIWYAVPEAVCFALTFGLLIHRTVGALGRWTMVLVAAALIPLAVEVVPGPVRRAPDAWVPVAILVAGVVVTLSVLARVASRRTGRVVRPGTAFVLACVGTWFLQAALVTSWDPRHGAPNRPISNREMLYDLGLWAREHVPHEAVLGAWSSGILTYFSERTIISLEGLANDLDYILHESSDPDSYLAKNGVAYVFGPGVVNEDGTYAFGRRGSYLVEWIPFPDLELGWMGTRDCYMLVRPTSSPASAFLHREDFPFGTWRPNPEPDDDALHPRAEDRDEGPAVPIEAESPAK